LAWRGVREVAQRLDLQLTCPASWWPEPNGKGSTCAMLDGVLRAAGYRVGRYKLAAPAAL